jgi:hypothetical protein
VTSRVLGVIVLECAAILLSGTGASAATREVSANWAGYAVDGAVFTSVSGTWVQPDVDCASTGAASAAFWVGLGGNSSASGSLEQAGTTVECDADGTATHWAWYELVPAAAVKLALRVEPGDTVSATVTVNGTRVTLRVRNVTSGTGVTKVKSMAAPDPSSAEWVAEAPSLCTDSGACRTVTLADFGNVRFTGASATAGGHTGTISDTAWRAAAIELLSDLRSPGFGRYAVDHPTAASAVPTGLAARGSAFSVGWHGVETTATLAPPGWP